MLDAPNFFSHTLRIGELDYCHVLAFLIIRLSGSSQLLWRMFIYD